MALNSEVKTLINDMADTIHKLYDIRTPISDIDQVVESIGGTVVENELLTGFSDGKIKKTGPDSFSIEISPFQTEERKNFTIAHELGHLFLHMGFQSNEKKWRAQDDVKYYRTGNSTSEYQANEFAAAFLMPRKEYKRIMDKYTKGNIVNTSEVAKYFHVSVDAAANRGKWLGYLEW